MKKYQRLTKNALKRLLDNKTGKIVAILGARQVGKTTLLLDFATEWQGKCIQYLGDKLEDALLWRGKFNDVKNNIELKLGIPLEKLKEPALIIFDEIQKIPEAFNNLKILHDQFKNVLKIAISGSSSLALFHRTSESLGGRVEIATMYPLSFTEIINHSPKPVWMANSARQFDVIKAMVIENAKHMEDASNSLLKAMSFGLFPEAYLQEKIEEVKILHQNYHQTYIEKDIRDLKEIGNVLDFDLIWKLAHRTNSQLLNYSSLANETGLAFNTVKKYVSVLSASFNIALLLPYTRNIRRRLTKSPKLFSVDVGFFNHCLNIYGREEMINTQIIGRVFESIMITEFLKQERSFLIGGDPYFFRTAAGAEVDLVVEKGMDLFAYEFKYSDKVTSSDFDGIKSLISASKNRVKSGFVVSRQTHAEKFAENLFAVPWWFFCI
jgi:predicted AAA+ superfamily ATPase